MGDVTGPRANTDTDKGQVYINNQTFSGQYPPTTFSFYADSTGQDVTPLLFSVNGSTYSLAAVYQSIPVAQVGLNSAALTLLVGSVNAGDTYVFGFSDQEVSAGSSGASTTTSYTGTIPFDTSSSGDWMDTQLGAITAVTLTLGTTFSTSSGANVDLYSGRVYSAFLGSTATPVGQIIVQSGDSNVFQESIGATVASSYTVNELYHNGHYGFVAASPAVDDPNDGNLVEDPWNYVFPTSIGLTLTSSVKADNPIALDFANGTPGSVTINSNAPVYFSGAVGTNGDATITAQGDITQAAAATIQTNNLTLDASNGSIGTSTQPIEATLATGGILNAEAGKQGVYLNLNSGAIINQVLSGNASDGYGDVVIQATNGLVAQPSTATTWVDDSTPPGSTLDYDPGDNWNWISSNPTPFSGTLADQSNIAAGEHQQFFTTTPAEAFTVASGDTLYAYVYLDPANPPSEVMLQWYVNGSWEHRAYWGTDDIGWGIDGTASRLYMGSLPATGTWVRLDVPASAVGLDGTTVSGMAFTLFGGRATWDDAGMVSGTDIVGNNITLSSSTGAVGTSVSPIVLQPNSVTASNGGVIGGVVTVSAQQGVGLEQSTGDLLVGNITSTSGSIYLDVPNGSIYDARKWVASGLTLTQAQQVWSNLKLTDSTAAQQSVTSFENQVNSDYQQYWQLLGNGTASDTAYPVPAGAQQLWNNATGGSFTISVSVNGQTETTGSIPFNANSASVQAALDQLPEVNVYVTGSGPPNDPWVISGTGLSALATNDSQLIGGTSTVQPVPSGRNNCGATPPVARSPCPRL